MKKHFIKLLLFSVICTITFISCEKVTEIRIPSSDTSHSQLTYTSSKFYGKVRTVTTIGYFSTWDEENEKIIPSELILDMEILEYDNKGIMVKNEIHRASMNTTSTDSLTIRGSNIYEYDSDKLRLTALYERHYYYSSFNFVHDSISVYKTTIEYDDDNRKATCYSYYTSNENVAPYEPDRKLIYSLRPDGHLGNLEAQYSPKRAKSVMDDDFEDEAYVKTEEIVLARDTKGNWTESYFLHTNNTGGIKQVYGWAYKKRILTYH